VKSLLKDSDFITDVTKDIYQTEISGVTFDAMHVTLYFDQGRAYQKHYVTKRNDYVLLFTSNTFEVQQKADKKMREILDTIKFN